MKKTIAALAASFCFACASLSAQVIPNKAVVSNAFDDLGSSFTSALTQVSGMQNIYADAHIGKIFPSLVPHFGGGVNAGVIRVDTSSLVKIFDELHISAGGVNDTMVLPSVSADIRLGGLFLPFDVGFMFLKTPSISFSDVSFGFTTFGVDARYAILEDDIAVPGLSIGLGYLYNGIDFDYSGSGTSVNYNLAVHSVYSTLQVSKKVLFVTPFAGARFMLSSANMDWKWNAGTGVFAIGDSGEYSSGFGNFQSQIFAGCGLDFLVFQTTLSVMADFAHLTDKKFVSGCLSFRAKL